VQADQQHNHRVDKRREVVRGQAVAEQAAVGQRELKVLGEQRGRQLLAIGGGPAGDHALRDHSWQAHPLQVAEQAVLAERDLLLGLLHRIGPIAQPDDPHHVPGQPAGERDDVLLRPVLERRRPRQRQQRGVRPCRDDVERHAGQARPGRP
jgi:hypothetical protein